MTWRYGVGCARLQPCVQAALRRASRPRATRAAAPRPNKTTIGGAGTGWGSWPPDEPPDELLPLVDELVLVDELPLVELLPLVDVLDDTPLLVEVEEEIPDEVLVEEPPVDVDVDDPPVEVEDPPVEVDDPPVEVEDPPVEVEDPPVEVELPPEPPLDVEVEPLVVEVTTTLPLLPPDPPKNPPAMNPPPKPPNPPEPPTKTGTAPPLPANADSRGSISGRGAPRDVTVVTVGAAQASCVVTTRRMRLTTRRQPGPAPFRQTEAMRIGACFLTLYT